MKLHEMFNLGPPGDPYDQNGLVEYLQRRCPAFWEALEKMVQERPEFNIMSVIVGMEYIIRYAQLYDMPDDIGEVLSAK